MVFGDIPADRLIAQISPIDWLIGPGPLAVTASLPGDETQFWLAFSATTDPIRPIEGEATTVRLTFEQSGPSLDVSGEVWLMDAYGTRLAKTTSLTGTVNHPLNWRLSGLAKEQQCRHTSLVAHRRNGGVG